MIETNEIPTNFEPFLIGLDDTDSYEGMCTTYLGTKLFLFLQHKPLVILKELPFLIRLNPNIPYRTKGNGSVIIKGYIHVSLISWFHSILIKFILSYSRLEAEKTNPGLVVWYGSPNNELFEFGKRALWDVIPLNDLQFFLELKNVFTFHPKEKYGLIGSFAGIGLSQSLQDFTFELLEYRKPPYTPKRFQNKDIVWNVNENEFNLFNCVDYKNKIIKIFPKGYDPVFCGIRGERPDKLLLYWKAIQPQPEMDCWMIFKSNQGTDSHLLNTKVNSLDHPNFSPYRVLTTTGIVDSEPLSEIGGHVSFYLKNQIGNTRKKCYAYEPTKEFRSIILQLIVGDTIEIGGNIRPPDPEKSLSEVINLEKIKLIKLVRKTKYNNPICPQCQKRMESAGKNQPFRCKNCNIHIGKENVISTIIERPIKENEIYLPAIDAQRHLTKPLIRENRNKFDEKNVISSILMKLSEQIT